MKSLTKMITTTLVLVATSSGSLAFADTSSTNASTNSAAVLAAKFDAQYQKNQQTENLLLQQAEKVQSAYSDRYATFVNSVKAEVGPMYASEQALTQLGFTWGNAIKGTPNAGLVKQERVLESRVKAIMASETKHKGKTPNDKRALAKARADVRTMESEIKHLNASLKASSNLTANSDAKYFAQNVTELRKSILGLQVDEIRVTKTWISSGTNVTGSVYGTQSSTNATTTTTTVTSIGG